MRSPSLAPALIRRMWGCHASTTSQHFSSDGCSALIRAAFNISISTTTLTSSPSGSTAGNQKRGGCSFTGSLTKPSPSGRPHTTPSSANPLSTGSERDTLFTPYDHRVLSAQTLNLLFILVRIGLIRPKRRSLGGIVDRTRDISVRNLQGWQKITADRKLLRKQVRVGSARGDPGRKWDRRENLESPERTANHPCWRGPLDFIANRGEKHWPSQTLMSPQTREKIWPRRSDTKTPGRSAKAEIVESLATALGFY